MRRQIIDEVRKVVGQKTNDGVNALIKKQQRNASGNIFVIKSPVATGKS